ncbi:MAG: DUF6788 family protein [Candidatus Eisenbacteria bacterium]
MTKDRQIESMCRRYKRLAARLAKTGLILQGSITERVILQKPPRRQGKQKAYGPYYQWTWKHQGKTVTVNLSASQAREFSKAIKNHRKMEEITRQMRELSLKILDATTKGVTKRKPRA